MNSRMQAFQDFLATQSVQVPVLGFLLNLILAGILAYLLGLIYIRFGEGLSNRRQFAGNFILLAMTTTLVISIIKSSLALSLGLVGALSIVRFRAAIKDPEELAYLFLTIAIGLGLGAQQRLVTASAFVLICVALVIRGLRRRDIGEQNLLLTISSTDQEGVNLDDIIDVLKESCRSVDLKRLDEKHPELQATFMVEVADYEQLKASRQRLQSLGRGMQITFLDNQGLI